MDFFGQMSQDQPLPIEVKRIERAHGRKLHAAATLARFEQQMRLGIMA